MQIKKISTDRDAQNETTVTWFDVDGESWGIANNNDGSIQLLDSDGCPIEDCNDHDNIVAALIVEAC